MDHEKVNWTAGEQDFWETGHDRGCGPSLVPGQARLEVSIPIELEAWLRQRAWDAEMTRAQWLRELLVQAQRVDQRAKLLTERRERTAS